MQTNETIPDDPTRNVRTTWVSTTSPTVGRAGHGSSPCQGVFHQPSRSSPTTAFIVTHYNVDFSEHYMAGLLAERGFGFLGWNTRYRGNEPYFLLEHALIDIGVGVRWLRDVANVDTVVILGNSGGGSLMGAYQSQATSPNIAAARGMKLPEAALDLPSADLYVSLNAHPGRPEVLTAWMDPSIIDENDPLSVDPDLDMHDANNGPAYSAEFLSTYRQAQRDRNERITDWAISELDRLDASGAHDRLFNVHRVWADPRFQDLTIDPSERTVGCYQGDARRANYGPLGIGRTSTLRSWLSMWSLRESQCQGAPHLARINDPALVVQSTGDRGVYPSDAHAINDALGSGDSELQFLPGEHYFEDRERNEVADLVADWVGRHT